MMVPSRRKEAENLAAEAERQGWRIKETRHGWLCFPPTGEAAVYIAGTPQDIKSVTNSRAQMRRLGLRWLPPPR